MKYLTIKSTRAIFIRYIIIIYVAWMVLVLFKNNELLKISLPNDMFTLDFTVVKPHVVGMGVLFLASLMVSHALSYRLSRWINNGKKPWLASFKSLFISWTLVSFILLFIVAQFNITNYVLVASLCPLVLTPLLSWELKRAARV